MTGDITVFAAKKIITLNRYQPEATHVALRDGRIRRMRLETKSMKEARAWIDNVRTLWEQQFDSLAAFLEATDNTKEDEKS